MNKSVWTWVVYALLGVLTISFLPSNYRWIIMVILLLGGIFYFESNGGLDKFLNTLEGKDIASAN